MTAREATNLPVHIHIRRWSHRVAVSQDRFSEIVVYPDMFYITAEGYPGEEITMLYIEPDQLTPVAFKCTFTESSALKIQVSSSGGVCMEM